MTPIRLVVSDVDGTLVDKDKQLTAETVAAVDRLEAAGVAFTVISARPRSGIMPIAATLGLDRPMGAFNGGIVFTRDGTVIEHHPIDAEAAKGAWAAAEGAEVDYWVFADDRWYASTDQGDHVASERVSSNQEPVIVSLDEMADRLDRADKVTFVSDDPPVLAALHDAIRHFGDRATIVQSQTYYLDVTALDGNKGAGIAALAAAIDAPLDATAAIGDQNNDLAMLDVAGYAVAMGNAPDNVKAAADATSRANDEDGVAWAIDHLILPRTGAYFVKQLVAFDLDGTLAESKQAIQEPMGNALADLLDVAHVAVISGGDWPQFQKQVASRIPDRAKLDRLWLMPTTGTKLYTHKDGEWSAVYAELFSDEEKAKIIDAFNAALEATGFKPEKTWGERIEDRGSQITFSALGQEAPLDAKEKWDPDFAKRKVIQADLKTRLPELSINMGGSTSIDITQKGVDKAYGLKKLRDASGISLDAMMFIGDAIFPGGNDYPAKELGLDTVRVRDVADTITAVTAIVACLK